jgi:16S rRNA processing protein RimM
LAARVFGTHGLKGFLKAEIHVELALPAQVELRMRDGRSREAKVTAIAGRTLKFEGFDSPEAARALGSSEAWIEREAMSELPEGEHYVADLVGKAVIDERRGALGHVAAVIETGKNHCLEIRPGQGETYLIPMTDDVILAIGSDVRVRLLPGLHPDESEEA